MAIEKDLLDQLLAGRDPKDVFNKDGLVDELKKALSERILNTELDEHLDSDGAGTWAMTLVIQRAEHRDTQAIHAKLDEILHALGASEMKSRGWMRNREPEEIEQGAVALFVGIRCGAISSDMKLSSQAARSIG